MFDDDEISWQWIEDHCQICRYSLDIRKCRNINCCKPSRVPEATTTLLQENNGFLPPMIKGRDQHFLNPIHILEYFDRVKIPPYDKYCPTISEEMHQRLCCSECGKYFPTLNFVQKHKQSQHSARKSRNSNSATHEFIYSQPYVLIEPYVSTQIKENDFEYSLSNSETLR